MGLTVEQYARMLASLLPPGRLWQTIGTKLEGLLLGCAEELARVDARVAALLLEADPSAATELLPEYERDLALTAAATTAERQARVTAQLLRRQRYRPQDFRTALAQMLGQAIDDVVVIERTPAYCATVGDQREIFRFFVYRDPSAPGAYYLDAAQAVVDGMKPAHTDGTVIESITFRCDDPHSLCDRDLLGA